MVGYDNTHKSPIGCPPYGGQDTPSLGPAHSNPTKPKTVNTPYTISAKNGYRCTEVRVYINAHTVTGALEARAYAEDTLPEGEIGEPALEANRAGICLRYTYCQDISHWLAEKGIKCK